MATIYYQIDLKICYKTISKKTINKLIIAKTRTKINIFTKIK